jgi:hypothetical protein
MGELAGLRQLLVKANALYHGGGDRSVVQER